MHVSKTKALRVCGQAREADEVTVALLEEALPVTSADQFGPQIHLLVRTQACISAGRRSPHVNMNSTQAVQVEHHI